MDYKEKCQILDAKILASQQIKPLDLYIRDGIVNLDSWSKQSIRPLFIGKEAYGEGFGGNTWSITSWLDNHSLDVCLNSPRSWQKTAYISYALQNNFTVYDNISYIRQDHRVANALKSIAFINVGKCSGDSRTPWQRLEALYKQNSSALHDQIELYQPNVIIGWSTLFLFERDKNFLSRFTSGSIVKQQLGSVDAWFADGKLFIDAYHPAWFGIKQEKYVDDVVAAIKINLDFIDQSLPKF